ncbi:kelch domain-containing protein 3-like [Amblyomma americanum]
MTTLRTRKVCATVRITLFKPLSLLTARGETSGSFAPFVTRFATGFDAVSLRWSKIPVQGDLDSVPFHRHGHTVVAYRDYVYLWGGRDDNGACNIVYRFDTASLTWLRPNTTGQTPRARKGHSACVVGSDMYVFGGFEDRLFRDVHVLGLDTMHWRPLVTTGASPEWRGFHSAVVIGSRIYVWGGRCALDSGTALLATEDYSNRLVYLDTASDVWVRPEAEGTRPLARCGHTAFVYNGEMYLFGGYNGLLGSFFADMYKYDTEACQWSEVEPIGKGPCPRTGHCCSLVGDRLFIFGGIR